MADSGITKRALAESLKELMRAKPFAKISIGEICANCGLNRKSFYYHFRDKYDLVCWLFDTEFLLAEKQKTSISSWHFLWDLCVYLDANRIFYRKALAVEGQNSLSDHMRNDVLPAVYSAYADETSVVFYVQFYSDAFLCSLRRWLAAAVPISPKEYVNLLFSCMKHASLQFQKEKSRLC